MSTQMAEGCWAVLVTKVVLMGGRWAVSAQMTEGWMSEVLVTEAVTSWRWNG